MGASPNVPGARWAVAVALGALVATTGDHLHVVYGVLFYPHPDVLQQAWWVFPLFAGATWAMVAASETARRLLSGEAIATSSPAGRGAEALLAMGAFLVFYAFTAVAAELPNTVLVVLVLTWLPRVRRLPRWVVFYGLVTAACGVAFEATLSAVGGFSYVNPDFLGVPRWLPGLYLHASIAAVRVRQLL